MGLVNGLDWVVLVATVAAIVAYGVSQTRTVQSTSSYLRGDRELRWPTIGLSVMATQASAITFLSVPGQAYEDGMRFVQFYFGLPLAMIVISAVAIPIYYRLKVYTAYEYLEERFDVRVRVLGALLFLVQRGLAAGITIYAPAIVLSSILGWQLWLTNLVIGVTVIVYTVSGGTKAVSRTQKQQMVVILVGMLLAFGVAVAKLPEGMGLVDAMRLAGAAGRMNVVNFEFEPNDRYNLWSGLVGGFFLQLSYFGTDQSQVQRYLTGRSVTESRLGLLFNGLMKIPMQFFILLVGIVLFAFHVFVPPPAFFNLPALEAAREKDPQISVLEERHRELLDQRASVARSLLDGTAPPREIARQRSDFDSLTRALDLERERVAERVTRVLPRAESEDDDYIFIHFVVSHLPHGLVGLLIAVILSAAMSSTASELNALGTTTTIDLYRRLGRTAQGDRHYLWASKAFTVFWGGVALSFATFASLLDNLIEAVNILGSLFFGTVLGMFLVAFGTRRVGATPTLLAALAAEATVVSCFFHTELGYLWFNLVGCLVTVGLAWTLHHLFRLARA
ncbi:MAG TPA: sodium:solute symporter [Myxococcales bacterium LLY-WYZ-16_1]|nr:sodium:solute symporter [Myxococcales bacterium LLY-WYZ-16_1]